MKWSSAAMGRVFVIRLEDGDIVHEAIESFAREQAIRSATLIALGALDRDSNLTTGPQFGRGFPVMPLLQTLKNVYEVCGTGTLFPNENGQPILNLHLACGRGTATLTGCVRGNAKTWNVMEIVLFELIQTNAQRVMDPQLGLQLLKP